MILAAALIFGFAVAAGVAFLAVDRPWLGLRLAGEPSGGLVVRRAVGPAAGITTGTVFVEVAAGGDRIALEPLDAVAEPDGALGTHEAYRRFLQRQERLSRMQASSEMIFTASDGTEYRLHPDPEGRPLGSLPAEFWVQLFVGLAAWIVSASVFAFRSREISARYLLLSGAATLTFAPLAAVYSTREFALPGTLFQWLSDLNFLGGSLFAGSFVALLLEYPKRIAPVKVGAGILLLYLLWFAAQQLGVFESMNFARRFLVVVGVSSTFALAGVHWVTTRSDPVARAALQWFLLSWMAGTMLFMFFILLPQMFGVDTSPLQGYSFLLFLLVYGGLAFGVLRFRLFELGDWWRRVAVWAVAILLLVVLDMVFVMGLHLSSEIALSLTLLICGVLWIPIRSLVWTRFIERRRARPENLFKRIVATAFAPPGETTQAERWERLLRDVFNPLEVAPEPDNIGEVTIALDGLRLSVPGVGAASALRLEYADGGRRLFSPRDAALASELTAMLRYALESKAAHERGVAEERGRIARDLHDTIGARLLSALHQPDREEKDGRIREAMADLRLIINNAVQSGETLEEALAELRQETAERLANVGVSLEWVSESEDAPRLDYRILHTVRTVAREAVSNIIRHAEARNVRLSIVWSDGNLRMTVLDDGKGFDSATCRRRHGLQNMRKRIEEVGGGLRFSAEEKGISLLVKIPFRAEETVQAPL